VELREGACVAEGRYRFVAYVAPKERNDCDVSTTAERLGAALAGRYRVERELGAGGMATVFLAEDLRHDREVAIKVLHPDLGAALGGDRFLAEIKTTARLQHPHILPLLDSGEADHLLFYVMPLVEGETLRSRLTRERQLPIETALRIAGEVASALDYAHRHGVIHRDIKPENILLHDGRATVADFGIALAVSAAGGTRMTQTGLSLGTPQYMSPEQAMGEKQVDARSDVYALGAVLYEMLTGEPPFTGATVQAIVAKVLTERPMHPTAVRDTIPIHVEATVLKALAKLPADRFDGAARFAESLTNPGITAGSLTAEAGPRVALSGIRPAAVRGPGLAVRVAPWGVAGVVAAVAVWAWTGAERGSQSDPTPAVRAIMPRISGTVPALIGLQSMLAVSADGRSVAFLGVDSTRVPHLYVQSVDRSGLHKLPGTSFANNPTFSPDGGSLAYTFGGNLMVQPATGGLVTKLTPVNFARGASWGSDGRIVYSHDGALWRISASGGTPESLAVPKPGEVYRAPSVIEGAGAVLFELQAGSNSEVAMLSLEDGAITRLGLQGASPSLVGDDLLLYGTLDGALWRVGFDAAGRRVTGEPQRITEGVSVSAGPRYAVSRNGLLVFAAGASNERDLLLVDRAGRALVASPAARAYRYPRYSPEGRRLAFGIMGTGGPPSGDVWVLNLGSGTMLRVTTDSASYHPEWDPDGRSLIHIKRTGTRPGGVYRTPADGTSPPVELIARTAPIWEARLTPDRATLVFREDGVGTRRDIFTRPADSAGAVRPLVASGFDEKGISLSPDGKWMAYVSDESGSNDVYIRRLEPGSPRWRVTPSGGAEPRWARTGELFFRSNDSVSVARVELGGAAGAEPRISAPRVLFHAGAFDASTFEALWDVSPDGQQFVFTRPRAGSEAQLVVLVNWRRTAEP